MPFATPGNFTALWKALVLQRNCWNARFKKWESWNMYAILWYKRLPSWNDLLEFPKPERFFLFTLFSINIYLKLLFVGQWEAGCNSVDVKKMLNDLANSRATLLSHSVSSIVSFFIFLLIPVQYLNKYILHLNANKVFIAGVKSRFESYLNKYQWWIQESRYV